MGSAIPQVITPSKATGAQVIDGSLKLTYNSSDFKYLTRTLGSGNRKTFTFSYWYKQNQSQTGKRYISTGYNYDGNTYGFYIGDNPEITFNDTGTGSANYNVRPSRKIRDNGWYHYVINLDTTQATEADRVRIYVNGVRQTDFSTNTLPSQNADGNMNTSGRLLTLGAWYLGGNIADGLQGQLAQFYHIDGQSLDASYFGFTDPLTNTWKPKKYTGTFTGTNTFYLPFDGKTPIGKDQSGNGNDFTPVNFGGSMELDALNVSGARPVLNTTQGGSQATVGVFGSKQNVGYAVTVYNDGGGNKYYIDGVKQDTVTGLIRGATYTFDTSDSTVSSHPFRFSATSNGSHGGGSEYTTGVAAITGAATTITVPHDAPNTLYYYCTSHSGMGADITGITTNEKLADQYASSCILALPMLDDEDKSNQLNITSATKSVTNNNVTTQGISHFYRGSSLFDSSSDYYRVVSTPFDYGSGDFTMEFWCYLTGTYTTARHVISAWNSAGGSGQESFYVGSGGANGYWASFGVRVGGTQYEVNGGNNKGRIPQNNWVHIAAVRHGTNIKLFVNGSLVGTTACGSGSITTPPTYVYIGKHYSASGYEWVGNLSDLRIYKGIAKYTEAFVPASTNPDIIPDTPSGVVGSSKLAKITEGAVSFDGGDDYLTLPSGADFAFGTGDFTVECYVYSNNRETYDYIIDGRNSGQTTGTWSLGYGYAGGNGRLEFASGSSTLLECSASLNPESKKWTHIAITRSGTSLRMFIDGVLATSATNSTNFSTEPTISYIGTRYSQQHFWDGFISNLRVIKGTALYTSDFTPPSAPLTNVTNTKLLCCQSNSSAVNYAVSPGTITANGGAAANTFNPFNTDINTVRGQETGYATLNPLSRYSALVPSDGNLVFTDDDSANGGDQGIQATILPTSGKYYWEVTPTALASENYYGVSKQHKLTQTVWTGGAVDAYFYYNNGKKIGGGNGNGGETYGDSFGVGDVIGVAVSWDDGTVTFYKNGVSQGVAFSGVDLAGYIPSVYLNTNQTGAGRINFGQKPFKFPPPDGFQPLNTANTRPVKVISRPDHYVGVTTYSGSTGTGTIKDDNINFTPDFVWAKDRGGTEVHALYDTVRGSTGGNFYRLSSNNTNGNNSPTNELTSMIRGGFTANNNGHIYYNGKYYVSWMWKAGGSKNTFNIDDVGYASAAAAGLDGGNINPTGCSIGTQQGFSILKYAGNQGTGQTLNHGLGEIPDFVICKNLGTSYNWFIWHESFGNGADAAIYFTNAAKSTGYNTQPFGTFTTSSLAFNNNDGVNGNYNYICYAWKNVPGLQKFGSYSGNSNADGSFVELGFRPALLWLKRTDSTGNWVILDTRRNPSNPVTISAYADSNSDANYDPGQDWADILSNGFKLRATYGEVNVGSYIYCAWAEAPTVDLYGGGANAR